MSDGSDGLTAFFARMRQGDADAMNDVMTAVYEEFHRLAARRLPGEGREQPVART